MSWRTFDFWASGSPTGDAPPRVGLAWLARAMASGVPQTTIPCQLLPQSLPSTTHFAVLEQWLWSGSPCMSLCKCCPTTFPRKLTETRRHEPR